MSKLEESDYVMMDYFFSEKGDVTRWVEWDEKSELLKEEQPRLYKAFVAIQENEDTVRMLLDIKLREYVNE